MTPELIALLCASLVALQMGAVWLRREHSDSWPYLGLLAACLAVLAWAEGLHHYTGALVFVAEAASVLLTFGPRFIDSAEQRALARDDLARATRVAALRELIVPGRGATRRRRHLADLTEARDHGTVAVVRRLERERTDAGSERAKRELTEELTTILVIDRQFARAAAEGERLGLDYAAKRSSLAAYLVRAYGELGQLAQAAALLERMEAGPAGHDPSSAALVEQLRLTLLAFGGRAESLTRLLAGDAGAMLPPMAHSFLRSAAERRAESSTHDAEVTALLDGIEARAAAGSARERPTFGRHAPVTWGLIGANAAAFLAMLIWLPAFDGAALVRAGALFRPAIVAGEWWRLYSSMFLHAGWLHIGVNMYGLYLLGRFCEDVFGSTRLLAVYLIGGLCGALSSTLMGQGALSVGASGAIMGLLGAMIVILVLRRGRWPEAWRRALLWNLVLIGGLQLFIGFQVTLIDNAAHIGGMIGGAIAALLLAPGGLLGKGRAAQLGIRAVTVVLVALAALSGAAAVRTSLATTLACVPTHAVEVAGVDLTVPRYWELDAAHGRLEDPYFGIEVIAHFAAGELHVVSPEDGDPRYDALIERVRASAHPAKRGET